MKNMIDVVVIVLIIIFNVSLGAFICKFYSRRPDFAWHILLISMIVGGFIPYVLVTRGFLNGSFENEMMYYISFFIAAFYIGRFRKKLNSSLYTHGR